MKARTDSRKSPDAISRRCFLGTFAAGAAAFTIVPRHVLGGPNHTAPSEKLNIAGIGVGGQGFHDLGDITDQNIVALCDVDDERAAKTYQTYPNAKRYHDFRVMLEKQKDIDAVVIATPDHMHAIAAMTAMQLGKHVYVEKPIAHTIREARMLVEAARKYRIVTQMGNQGHSGEGVRMICEWIWDGAIGPVRQVYAWTNRPVWPQGISRPADTPAVPDTLRWDLWLGPAPERPYNPAYVPFKWRGWWDFGCGALGDMGCHVLDPVFWALKLRYPESIEACYTEINDITSIEASNADSAKTNDETFPVASIVRYEFGARGDMPPVKVEWLDGGLKPPRPDALEEGRNLDQAESNVLFIGDKGILRCGEYGNSPRIIPESKMQEYKLPPKTLPRIDSNHRMNWVNACKGEGKACSNFDYAGPLTEMVLLGNIALKAPNKKLLWDGVGMQFTNLPDANQYLGKTYRQGWEPAQINAAS